VKSIGAFCSFFEKNKTFSARIKRLSKFLTKYGSNNASSILRAPESFAAFFYKTKHF